MKIIYVFVMFVLLCAGASAQDAKVVAELAARSDKPVKNSPFSADALSESVQTLADGNRIVRDSTSKLYRNSEGRFRREMSGGSGGVLGSLYSVGQGVTILDPVGGFRYMIDPNLKTTRQVMISPRSEVRVITGQETTLIGEKLKSEIKAAAAAARAASVDEAHLSEKYRTEIRTAVAAAPAIAARAVTGALLATDAIGGFSMAYSGSGQYSKWETRTDQLGTQNIEGVEAEGTRTVTTIPAGAIGNERAIEITYEKWFSPDLQLVVMSKHNDPRFGEQTYRLTNINRSEPDPSLFTPPHGYKMVTEPSASYTYTTGVRAPAVEKAAAAKAARADSSGRTKP